MNKSELSEKISEKTGLLKGQAEEVLETFINVVTDTLRQGGEVTLTGFGTFSSRKRKGREGINPRNPSEKITIPSVVVAKFKAGKNLKETLKNSDSDKDVSSAKSESQIDSENQIGDVG